MAMSDDKSPKVGKLRPSQVVTQHGPGAVVDLPELSVIVAGINKWFVTGEDRVFEPRLEKFLKVRALHRPPQPGPGKFGGLPSFVFPEWLVCPRCRLLAPWKQFHFKSWPGEFLCTRDGKHDGKRNPNAFPARFMVACANGHLDDFPWHLWVHREVVKCSGPLELWDTGSTGSASDLLVACTSCDAKRSMGDAFKPDADIGPCSGRRPWLSLSDYQACGDTPKTILRGASNAYFPIVSSALSIPPWSDPIHQELTPFREGLLQAATFEKFKAGIEGEFYAVGDLLERYTIEQLWKALHAEPEEEEDLKRREYESFLDPAPKPEPKAEFEIERQPVPLGHRRHLKTVVAALRLREVRALRGFTRIDSSPGLGEITDITEFEAKAAPIRLKENNWLPGIDLRGEGIFIEVDGDALDAWAARPAVAAEGARKEAKWKEWLLERREEERPFPGIRFIVLHTLAHILMRQLSLDSGYSSSALRERIYSSTTGGAMTGILLYTATSDSDGSLGGLVDQAVPDRLGPLLMDALREAAYCAQDPLCGGADIGGAAHLNGAACHACLLLAETSCEVGNRLLDRAVLVRTLGDRDLEFFT